MARLGGCILFYIELIRGAVLFEQSHGLVQRIFEDSCLGHVEAPFQWEYVVYWDRDTKLIIIGSSYSYILWQHRLEWARRTREPCVCVHGGWLARLTRIVIIVKNTNSAIYCLLQITVCHGEPSVMHFSAFIIIVTVDFSLLTIFVRSQLFCVINTAKVFCQRAFPSSDKSTATPV